jgi:hypothetical protein
VTLIQLGDEEIVLGAMEVEAITPGEPEPAPSPEPEPEPEPAPGGIPGFPSSSVVFGLVIGLILLWTSQSRRKAETCFQAIAKVANSPHPRLNLALDQASKR